MATKSVSLHDTPNPHAGEKSGARAGVDGLRPSCPSQGSSSCLRILWLLERRRCAVMRDTSLWTHTRTHYSKSYRLFASRVDGPGTALEGLDLKGYRHATIKDSQSQEASDGQPIPGGASRHRIRGRQWRGRSRGPVITPTAGVSTRPTPIRAGWPATA